MSLSCVFIESGGIVVASSCMWTMSSGVLAVMPVFDIHLDVKVMAGSEDFTCNNLRY